MTALWGRDMTDRPEDLTGRADETNCRTVTPADPLSGLLRAVRLTGAMYYRVSTTLPWPAIQVPPGRALVGAFGPPTRNVASFHVVTEGSCWTGTADGRPVLLEAGDVVVYPLGHAYYLGPDPRLPRTAPDSGSLVKLLTQVSSGAVPPMFTFGDGLPRTSFVCGFLGCDLSQFDPVLSLPPMVRVRSAGQPLAGLVELALTELTAAPGAALVRERLSESMFLETIRQHLADRNRPVDGVAARALGLIEVDLGGPWSLGSLAAAAGVSRSVLIRHFSEAVGQPPMQYLTRRRMQVAHELLAGPATVAAVARAVGYGSEAAFSRAFKRSAGVSPDAWRHARDRAPAAVGL
jgi:AraC-like DNA-binding protein